MKIENLQYQISTGKWIDCDDETDNFLDLCVEYGDVSDETEAIEKLTAGEELRNDPEDWYSNCRIKPEPVQYKLVEMAACSCGCTVPKTAVMNAIIGTSCSDCYDRMSC